MEGDITIEDITKEVESASTNFEKTNTELKRKYLIWNINAFNILAYYRILKIKRINRNST